MARSFLDGPGPRALAAAAALLLLLSLARVGARRHEAAFFGMLFPELVYGEATPGEAVAL